MFEIERQCAYDHEICEKIITDSQFIKETKNHDIYYDTDDFKLTSQDAWLRKRNGEFQIKVVEGKGEPCGKRKFSKYKEITDEQEICAWLKIENQALSDKVLQVLGYIPFLDYEMNRNVYQQGEITMCVDVAYYKEDLDNPFKMFEVEIEVESQGQMGEAQQKMEEFFEKYNFEYQPIYGKVFHYIHKYCPEQYLVMKNAGVM